MFGTARALLLPLWGLRGHERGGGGKHLRILLCSHNQTAKPMRTHKVDVCFKAPCLALANAPTGLPTSMQVSWFGSHHGCLGGHCSSLGSARPCAGSPLPAASGKRSSWTWSCAWGNAAVAPCCRLAAGASTSREPRRLCNLQEEVLAPLIHPE